MPTWGKNRGMPNAEGQIKMVHDRSVDGVSRCRHVLLKAAAKDCDIEQRARNRSEVHFMCIVARY